VTVDVKGIRRARGEQAVRSAERELRELQRRVREAIATALGGKDENMTGVIFRAARIELLDGRHAAVAEAALTLADRTFTAQGTAKRQPGDPHDPDIAASLAVGRALEELGRQLQRHGHAQVALASAAQARQISRSARRAGEHARRRLLPLGEIRSRYGAEAAQRADARRARQAGTADGPRQIHAG